MRDGGAHPSTLSGQITSTRPRAVAMETQQEKPLQFERRGKWEGAGQTDITRLHASSKTLFQKIAALNTRTPGCERRLRLPLFHRIQSPAPTFPKTLRSGDEGQVDLRSELYITHFNLSAATDPSTAYTGGISIESSL